MNRGRIPEAVIDAVLGQHDIVEVVGKTVHLVKRGKNLVGLCPFHSEKTPSFTVSPEKQSYHCFGCGAGGNVIRFVMESEGLSFPEAVRRLAEEAGIPFAAGQETFEETEEQKQKRAIIEAHEFAATLYHHLLKNTSEGYGALAYLRSRGFTDKWIDEFKIGYAPDSWDTLARLLGEKNFDLPLMEKGGLLMARTGSDGYYDRFRNRILFPIHDPNGRIIGFSGRVIGDGQPKYLNSPETPVFAKSRTLFNLHRARPAIRKSGRAVLFEGHVDVIKAYGTGTKNAIATMGTALTEQHCAAIRRLAADVVICYDGDEAGRSAAARALVMLEQSGCNVTVAMLPDGMDPDDYIAKHGGDVFRDRILDGAVPSAKFKLLHMRRRYALSTDEGKLRYIQAALKLIAELPFPTEREFYVKELSDEYGFSIEALNEQLYQIRRGMQKNRNPGDNNPAAWNNVMQSETGNKGVPALRPAYHIAERKLLALMLEDRDIALYVQERLAEGFNVEAHAAIAAYLYAYYAEGNEPNPGRFIAGLDDPRLMDVAGSLALEDTAGINSQAIDDFLKEIRKYPKIREIRRKKEEQKQADRSGDLERAQQIGMEIISLERELKSI
jgi:DNA primase